MNCPKLGSTGTRMAALLALLMVAGLGTSSCRTPIEAARIEIQPSPAEPHGCADEDLAEQRRHPDLVAQRAAIVRLRGCVYETASRLKRVKEAPRPCDHDTIGANPILCPTVDAETDLLRVTIVDLNRRLDVLGQYTERQISAGAAPDASNFLDVAERIQRAVHRADARLRLLDEDLHEAIWGWVSCPAEGGGKTTCACSASSTCVAWTGEPPCRCAPSRR